MTYQAIKKNWRNAALLFGAAALLSTTGTVLAQEADEEDEFEEIIETVIVTGSRIKRASTFTSTSPLAVIDGDDSIRFGAIDASSMLRQSTSVSGQQIDSSMAGLSGTDSGPGANTVGLRGLGAERTLVLMDGRRIGPAGNLGDAVFVDISLIPSFLVERAEILLSGASSIYGADAVAGVINIITPTDFEGVQLDTFYGVPKGGVGEEKVISFQFGGASDRGRFYLGAEYFSRESVAAKDRDFTPFLGDVTVDDNGVVTRTPDGFVDQSVAFVTTGPANCFFVGYTPGQMLGGSIWPNYSCDDGFVTSPYSLSVEPYDNFLARQNQMVISPTTKWAGFASVEYDLDMFGDLTAFAQIMISSRKSGIDGGDGQFFPNVPAINEFNPFGGTVVAAAFDRGLRGDVDDTTLTFQRFVGGFKGNLDVLNNSGLNNWTWEFSLGYSRGEGTNRFDIILLDRYVNSINNCTNPAQDTFGGFSPTCVPTNLFGDDFMLRGDVGAAAREYIVTRVTNNTLTEQTAYELGATGDIFDLPAGPVGLFLGVSRRADSINSNVDSNIETGNAWGVSSEGDTIGKSTLKEAYGEIDVPLLAGKTGAESVGINASIRLTDDKFFGSHETWRVTGHWDFTDYLRLRGTVGTSFRAPNLRDLFLADQTGFASAFIDPCVVPAGDDTRSQVIIDNCISEGVDPFTLGGTAAPSVPTVTGGGSDLRPETSDSWSVGAVFSQPWFDSFDFQFSIDYTSIKIKDAVGSPSLGFILNECYTSPGLSDPLCDRVERNVTADPDSRFLLSVNDSVANIEVEDFEDISFSTLFNYEFSNGMNLMWNADFTRMLGLKEGLFIETADEFVGTISTPKWQALSTLGLSWNDWSLQHRVRYRGSGAMSEAQLAASANIPGDKTWIDEFWSHSFSLSYTRDTWRAFLTLQNAFNEEPDVVDDESFSRNVNHGVPQGIYPLEALAGRTLVLSLRYTR